MSQDRPFFSLSHRWANQWPPVIVCNCQETDHPHSKEACTEPAVVNTFNIPIADGLCALCQDAIRDQEHDV